MSRVGLVLLCLYLAVALCPEPPHEWGHGYDRSFLLGLSAAHAQGVVFGEQLIYPYGPLAYLCRPLPVSGAVGAAFAGQLAVFAAFMALLVLLVRRVEGRWTALWCLVVIGAAGLLDPMALWLSHLEIAVPVLALLAFVIVPARRLLALAGLAALAATLLLVKLDAGVNAIVLCAALSLHTAVQRRADKPAVRRLLLLPPAVFLLTLSLLFWLESGRLGALPAFLRNSLHVMLGYKEMSVDGTPGNLVPMLAALAAVFLLLPLLVRDRRRLVPALLIMLVPAFMLWQRVAMRQDEGHQVSFLPRLAVLLLFPLLSLATVRDRVLVVVVQVLVLITGGLCVESWFPIYHPDLADRITGRQAIETVAAMRNWDETSRSLEEESIANGAPLRLGPRARAFVGDGTVDAVPWEIERVMAHRWHWRPRPAFQSGNAYSPPLDRLDGQHFAGGDAARFVLADVDAIDNRHIFLEAPLTWRALLDRYDLRADFPGVLLLERRTAPRFDSPRSLGSVTVRWDQPLELPADDDLLALSCRIAPGLAGQLAGLFYRNAAVSLDVRFRSGVEQRWRAVRPNLESGAIVSHLPIDLDGLGQMFAAGPGETDRVESIRLHTDEPWQYDPLLHVTWWALPLRTDQRPWRAEERPPQPVAPAWSMLGEDCAEGETPVLKLTGEPRLGQALEITVERVPPGSRVRILIGAEAVELRRGWSTLFVDPGRMLTRTIRADEAGVSRLRVPVPAQPRLTGLEVTLQAVVPNAPGERPAWLLSCGLRLIIGN